jgi:alpha-glucosidase
LRRQSAALRTGSMRVIEASQALLAFERKSAHQELVCVFNLGAEAQRWQPREPDRWRVIASVGDPKGWLLPRFSGLIAERIA